jgi:hypothetical protein
MRGHAGTLIAKPSAIDTVNQMQDRCRSFVERMVQEEALDFLAANKGAEIARCIGFELLGYIDLRKHNGRTWQKLFLRESVVFIRKPMVTINASP